MKLLIKRFFVTFVVMLFTLFALASCQQTDGGGTNGDGEPNTNSEMVQISKITAIKESPSSTNARQKKHNSIRIPVSSYDDSGSTIDSINTDGTIVIYKSETDIKFTITLDNPKGEAIDAVQLVCDDPGAQIYVSGEWDYLADRPEGYIVNWSSENAYRKTYYLKTTSQDSINTLRVIDLKVNGQWQNKALENDKLQIIKLDEMDLKVGCWTNTFGYYEGYIQFSTKIKNLELFGSGIEIIAHSDETVEGNAEIGLVRFRKNAEGTLRWAYDYEYNGVTTHWGDKKEIEFLRIEARNSGDTCYITPTGVNLIITGTDVEIDIIYGKVQTQTGMDKLNFCQKLQQADPEHYISERYLTYNNYFDTENISLISILDDGDIVYLYIANQWYSIPLLINNPILQQDPIEINGLD